MISTLNDPNIPPHPPPRYIPPYNEALQTNRNNMINQHMQMFIYVWLISGANFWMYPTHINNNHVYGYVWLKARWAYTKFNLNKIDCLY